ncbi:MAG: DUF6600 domain-containing protein [Thermodesulfovibrionales bacterium]
MNILKTVMLVVVLLLVPGYAFSANLGYMRISLIDGDVQIKTPDADDWGYASVNTPLAEGDQIWAPQGGRVELQLNSGSYIRLSEDSALQILSMDKDSSQFYLSQGSAYIYYNAARRSVIQVDTPDASTRAFRSAIFRIDMSAQYTDVAVYKGTVETENRVGRTTIRRGQMVSLGQNTNGELAPMGPSDAWETWNKTRNNRILGRKGSSSRYLPAELAAYSYDFDNSGRWVQVPDYGNVWTPTVSVGANWSPYREGRWIWRGDDYVWVASEPWGWAPYHYGRWSFGVSIGWFWVPPVTRDVYWSPGYVGWVRTAEYVAWVPLGPGETYYGRGNYGRNSVNITNININQVNITTVYRNVNVNNAVTVVNRNTFNTATPTIVNVNKGVIQEKIFVKNNFIGGAHDIKPVKASYFASTRQIQPAKLPPQPVRNLQVKELKQSRPLIKDQSRSVITPGIKPKALPVTEVKTPRTPGKGKPMILPVRPDEKGKTVVPQERPNGRTERQQIKPLKRKPAIPEAGPDGRGEKQQFKPVDKKPAVTEGAPTGRGQQWSKPVDKKPAVTEGAPTPRVERQRIKPVDKKPTVTEGAPTPKVEKQRIKPAERKPAVSEDTPAPKAEKQRVAPAEKRRAVVPQERPAGRAVKQQVKPVDRKPAVSEDTPVPKVEKQRSKPEEKEPSGPEGDRGKKDKKKSDELDESPQKDKKKQDEEERKR